MFQYHFSFLLQISKLGFVYWPIQSANPIQVHWVHWGRGNVLIHFNCCLLTLYGCFIMVVCEVSQVTCCLWMLATSKELSKESVKLHTGTGKKWSPISNKEMMWCWIGAQNLVLAKSNPACWTESEAFWVLVSIWE